GPHDNVLLAQEISFKAGMAALVVAADGSASHHADATTRAERNGLFRQRLPDFDHRRPCSGGRFCRRHLLRPKPRPQRLHVNPACPDPATASHASGTTSGESEIGYAS